VKRKGEIRLLRAPLQARSARTLFAQLRAVSGTKRDATELLNEAFRRRLGRRVPKGPYTVKGVIRVP
jgi:hypothetical protein